jgi:hypothetical protein
MQCGFVSVLGDDKSILIAPDGSPIEMLRSPHDGRPHLLVQVIVDPLNNTPFIGIGFDPGLGTQISFLYDSGRHSSVPAH